MVTRQASGRCERPIAAIWRCRAGFSDARRTIITEGALEGVNLCTHLLSGLSGSRHGLKSLAIFRIAKSAFLTAGLKLEGWRWIERA